MRKLEEKKVKSHHGTYTVWIEYDVGISTNVFLKKEDDEVYVVSCGDMANFVDAVKYAIDFYEQSDNRAEFEYYKWDGDLTDTK